MNIETILLACAFILILEGLGPAFFPKQWQQMLVELSKKDHQTLRRIGGSFVVAGVVMLVMLLHLL